MSLPPMVWHCRQLTEADTAWSLQRQGSAAAAALLQQLRVIRWQILCTVTGQFVSVGCSDNDKVMGLANECRSSSDTDQVPYIKEGVQRGNSTVATLNRGVHLKVYIGILDKKLKQAVFETV